MGAVYQDRDMSAIGGLGKEGLPEPPQHGDRPEIDLVEYDGKIIKAEQERVVLMLNKPRGVICTASDPQGRPTVMEYFRDLPYRVYNIGRLDYDSEGLLLFTNDGELAYRLTHPKFMVRKTYYAVTLPSACYRFRSRRTHPCPEVLPRQSR